MNVRIDYINVLENAKILRNTFSSYKNMYVIIIKRIKKNK